YLKPNNAAGVIEHPMRAEIIVNELLDKLQEQQRARSRQASASAITRSQRAQEHHQVLLLRRGEFSREDEVEELDRVLERAKSAVMQIRRRVLDAAQRKGLDRAVGARHYTISQHRLVEALGAQIVH